MARYPGVYIVLYFAAPYLCPITDSAIIGGGIEIPTFTQPCRRHSPGFNKCIQNALQTLIPKLGKRGIPELELDTMDPLQIPEMVFSFDSLADVGGKLIVNDSIATGMSSIKITGVRSKIVEGQTFDMDIDYAIKRIQMLGRFTMHGRLGRHPVSGSGPYNVTTGQVTGTWKLRGVQIEGDNESYIKLTEVRTNPSVGYFKVHADNLVNGNKELTSAVITFANTFWELLYHQTWAFFEQSFDNFGREFLNKIFLKIPYNQLFPKK